MGARRYDNILETIGETPIVRINKLAPVGVNVFVKVEAFNPMGSVKDRMARAVIEEAERSGALRPGQTVVEATSGNTGIGLAMVCAQKGYPLVVTMAENFSVERRRLMRFLGAKVVLTPANERGTGMLAKAAELADAHGWFLARQFENEANARVHSETTAREILAAFEGEQLDYWVTGFGTGGTLKGVARVLRRQSPDTRVAVCEPDNAGLLGSGIPQPRRPDGSPETGHPAFRTHLVQGWSPDFIAKLAEDARRAGLVDELIPVRGDDALETSRQLARLEGIFAGISGGATLAGALTIAQQAPVGANILCMLPDTGERYLSTPLFADVSEEMSAEEERISRSTPNHRFDVAPNRTLDRVSVDRDAITFVDGAINDPEHGVVLFALEYCEFCWSVRKLLDACGIDYRIVEVDSAELQQDGRGDAVHAALIERIGSTTLPQLFVGGELVGGCTEVLGEYQAGELQARLSRHGVAFRADAVGDPARFFPAWLHPRAAQGAACGLGRTADASGVGASGSGR